MSGHTPWAQIKRKSQTQKGENPMSSIRINTDNPGEHYTFEGERITPDVVNGNLIIKVYKGESLERLYEFASGTWRCYSLDNFDGSGQAESAEYYPDGGVRQVEELLTHALDIIQNGPS